MANYNTVESKCITQHGIPRNKIVRLSLKAKVKMGSSLSEAYSCKVLGKEDRCFKYSLH